MDFGLKYEVLPNGCHRWTAALNRGGYGVHVEAGHQYRAHQYAYMRKHGAVPEDKVLDHFLFPESCIGRNCCNPDHVRPTTALENLLRGYSIQAINAAKTQCLRGHPFDEENTYICQSKEGPKRVCRACKREKAREPRARARNREAVRRYRERTRDGSSV